MKQWHKAMGVTVFVTLAVMATVQVQQRVWAKHNFRPEIKRLATPTAIKAIKGPAAASFTLAASAFLAPEIDLQQPVGTPLSGGVVAWGNNNNGQTNVPAGLTGVKAIAAGGIHTVALKSNGTVVAWGSNGFGQTTIPTGLTGVSAIAAGGNHTVALKSNGSVSAWGNNNQGQASVPAAALSGVTAIAAGGFHSVARKSDGSVVAWGRNVEGQVSVPAGLTGVSAIAAGGHHTLALKGDGSVVAWGNNASGQTSVPAGLTNVTAIAAGESYSVVLKNDGSVVAWGDNTNRQVNVPAGLSGVIALAAGGSHTVALKSDNSIVAWGFNSAGQTTVPAGLTGVTALAAGAFHTVALQRQVSYGAQPVGSTSAAKSFTIKNTGPGPLTLSNVSVTGGNAADFTVNTNGMLASVPANSSTTFTVSFTPAAAGARTTVLRVLNDDADESIFDIVLTGTGSVAPAVTAPTSANLTATSATLGGTVISDGGGTITERGVVLSQTSLNNDPLIGGAGVAKLIVSGTTGFFSLSATGLRPNTSYSFKAYAANSAGTAYTTPTATFTTLPAPEIVVEQLGAAPSRVVAWGQNNAGQTNVPAALADVTAIAAGNENTFALTSNGSVSGWGSNSAGQISVPAGLSGVTALAAGFLHTVALKSDGSVMAWGGNNFGQTTLPAGLTGVTAMAAGGVHTVALKHDGTVIAWGRNDDGQTDVPAGLSGVTAIAAGAAHTVAVKSDGSVVAWGNNSFNQRNVPAGLTGVTSVAAGGNHSVALKSNGSVVVWGDNRFGQTTVPAGLFGVTALAAGYAHTVALKSDGSVAAWGDNSFGQRNVPAGLTAVSTIAAGTYHTVALQRRTDFGNQPVGVTSAAQTFTIKNLGSAPLSVSSVSVTGGNAADFTVNSSGLLTSVPANGSTVFSVSFTPSAAGTRSAILRILNNDADESVCDILVTGTGLAVPVVTAPTSANLGVTTATLGGNVTNDGSSAILERGVVLSETATNDNPLIGGAGVTKLTASGTTGVFTVNATGLIGAVGYSFKAYATNSLGTAYTPVATFTTLISEIALEQPVGNTLGNVIVWGDNEFNQTSVPAGLTGVKAVAAGVFYIVALKSDGRVVAWGDNSSGQLNVPVGLTGVKAIAAGYYHGLALKGDGSISAWGNNSVGQTNVPAGLTGVTAIAAGYEHGVALKRDGSVAAWGANSAGQTTPPVGLAGVTAITAGFKHTVALKSDGSVVAWGLNNVGQTNVPAGLADVTAIAASGNHTLALKRDGSVVAWGRNNFGQTNVPAGLTGVTAIAAGYEHSVAFKRDGSVVAWGSNNFGPTTVPAGLTGVVAIAAGWENTIALQRGVGYGNQPVGVTGQAKTFTIKNTGTGPLGLNSVSMVGEHAADFSIDASAMLTRLPALNGSTTFTVSFTPSALGARRAILRIANDDSGAGIFDVALTGTGVDAAPFVIEPTSAVDATSALLGGHVASDGGFAITERGVVLAETNTNSNPLIGGAGVTKLIASGTTGVFTVNALGLTPGSRYSFKAYAINNLGTSYTPVKTFVTNAPDIALKQPVGNALGSVRAWGWNAFGQTDVPVALRNPKAIAAGYVHTLALKADGSVVAWGDNSNGQLDVPAGLGQVTAIAAGFFHSVALKNDGSVVAWGLNHRGQANVPAGLTGVIAIAAGQSHTAALKSDGSLVIWGDNANGQGSIPAGLTDVTAVAAGGDHTVALKRNGTVVAWGLNDFGQTSVPAGLTGVIAIATGEVHTLALKSDGSVVAWGLNDFGQTSVPAGLTGVTAISVGATHSVALKSDDNVVAWGNNGHGETDVPVGLSNVTAIAAGYFHTVAMTADLSVSYGNQAVAQASGPRTLEIRNSGTSTLTVSSVSVTGGNAADFTVNTSGMLTRVPVQGSTTFTVSFTPSAVGVRATTLRILSDDPDEGTLDVALTGTGFNTPPTITANSLTRSVGTTNANLAIAQVSDAEQAANSLAAQVNNAASATVNGVTVSELTIDAAGLVTAKVAVNCNAANTAFTLKVTDLAGAAATATLNVAVTAVGTATITTQPVKRTVNANESATFSVTATGSDLAYQWRKNGVAMANGWSVQGATTATLTLNPALASDAGSYDVIVSNGCQSLTSAPAALTLNGATAPLLVNEFRFSGPQGAGDWYVELFNNTDAPIRTNGLVIAFADAAGLLSETFPLTLERTIPAKGCYLIAGPQYSLSLAAAADQVLPNFTTLTSLGGVALFADTPQSARRLDSVAAQGFVQSSILQYFVEGTATANVGNPLTEYAWVRKATSLGLPSDTNNNAADFILVAPTATPLNGTTPQPGAPGPQSSASPLVNNAGLPVALLNPANSATSGPNTFVENVAVTVGVATYPRSLYLRRTLTNNTNKPVTKLRFRITEISNGGVNTAILRALSSDDITINGLAVKGLTLETPPLQPTGGGLNSTLSAGAITLAAPLTAGAKVNVQFRLGVVQGGSYRFYANIEAAN